MFRLALPFLLAAHLHAEVVRLEWQGSAERFKVYKESSVNPIAETAENSVEVDLIPSDVIHVVACQAGQYAASEKKLVSSITYMKFLLVEGSENMQDWSTLLLVPQDRKKYFIRAKTIEIPFVEP